MSESQNIELTFKSDLAKRMNLVDIQLPYFNGRYNPFLTTSPCYKLPSSTNVIKHKSGEGEFHWGMDENGVVTFGYWAYDPAKRPGHGGYWSSREGVVGPLIGQKLVPVVIDYVAVSMTVEALSQLLPLEFHIVERQTSYGETVYEVQRKDGKQGRWEDDPLVASHPGRRNLYRHGHGRGKLLRRTSGGMGPDKGVRRGD